MPDIDISKQQGLCFRCEHRAIWFEVGIRPRYECGVPDGNKMSCYMYMPVRPVVVKRQFLPEEDPRPENSGLFGCRMEAVRVLGGPSFYGEGYSAEAALLTDSKDDGESVRLWMSTWTQKEFTKQ